MTRRILTFLVPMAVVWAFPASLRAAGVVGTGTPASCTQAALGAAVAGGGTVTFNCGPAAVTIPMTSEQVVSASTTIDGGGLVTLDGQFSTRLFRVPDAAPGIAFTVQRLELRRGLCPLVTPGTEPGLGGAIAAGAGSQIALIDASLQYNSCRDNGGTLGRGGVVSSRSGSVLLRRVEAGQNSAGEGGVVHSLDSAVTIEDSELLGNSPSNRGGVVAALSGTVAFRRNYVFVAHATTSGGCIDAVFGAGGPGGVTIEDSRIVGVTTYGDGGAVRQQGGRLTVSGSTIGGRAARGGGLFVQDSPELSVVNTTFIDNHADTDVNVPGSGRGGAFYLAGANQGSIRFTTLSLNDADVAGGAFAGDGPSAVRLEASVLGANATGSGSGLSPACAITLAGGDYSIQAPGALADDDCAPLLVRTDPQIEAVFDPSISMAVFVPDPNGPVVDRVFEGCPPPATDQRHYARPQGEHCDAGSYELPPRLTMADADIQEGNAGTSIVSLRIQLFGPSSLPVVVPFSTANDSATAGVDYVAQSGVVTFPPGTTVRTVDVVVVGDVVDEGAEGFFLNLGAAQNAVVIDAQARATIIDDDGPVLTVGDTATVEGDAGSHAVQVPVTLSGPSVEAVTVPFTTLPGTALEGIDYQFVNGTLTFAPGVVSLNIPVSITGDALDEPDERFRVFVGNVAGATPVDQEGLVTITDDDGGVIRVGELTHGSMLRADLVNGPDLYILTRPIQTSWELVIDEASGDLGSGDGPLVELLAGDLTTVEAVSQAVGVGPARSLRTQNLVAFGVTQEGYVRVSGPGCGTSCGPDDVYRIRAYDTTLRAPRFNCPAITGSVLVLQNTGATSVFYRAVFWKADGQPVTFGPTGVGTLAKGGSVAFNVCISEIGGYSGSVTVAHNGAHGQLVGKVVQVDPATGASFDTPLTVRPR